MSEILNFITLDETKQTIIIIATIILIIYLIIIGLSIYKSQYNNQYPPVIPECPDYWDITEDKNCINSKKIGTCQIEDDLKINLNEAKWKGKTGMCAKYQFAKRCNLQWDGISGKNELCRH